MSSPTDSRRGLANVGNTCYLNSAIQALRHVRPFAEFLGTDAWSRYRHTDRKGDMLAIQTAALLRAFEDPAGAGKIIVPVPFVKAFIEFAREFNDDIRYGAQADAAEALQILLDGLHTTLAREVRMTVAGEATTPEHTEIIKGHEAWANFFRKEYSVLVETFYGQTQTKVVCGDCSACSARYEPWSVMKAPIPGAEAAGAPAPTLRECLAAAFAKEKLDDYACDICKKRGAATMSHAISVFPPYLILSLKRFTNTGAKVRARLPYDPDTIDLCEWRAWPSSQSADKCRYRLISTIEHLGGSRGGHYCMRARQPDNTWLVYDDGMVSPSSIGGAAGPDTYVLILERVK